MLKLNADQLPCGETELRRALMEYQDLLLWHRTTEGEPAPWPDHEILRGIVAAGGEFEVAYPPAPPEPTPRELALRAMHDKLRLEAMADENRLMVAEARKPDAPQELKDYVEANPELVAAVDAEAQAKRRAEFAIEVAPK